MVPGARLLHVCHRRFARAFDAVLVVCLLTVRPALAQSRPRRCTGRRLRPAIRSGPLVDTHDEAVVRGAARATLQQPSSMPMPPPLQTPEVQKEIVGPAVRRATSATCPRRDYWDKFLTYDPRRARSGRAGTRRTCDLEDFYQMVGPSGLREGGPGQEEQARLDPRRRGVLAAAGITTGFIIMFQPITPTDCGGYFGCQYDNTQHVGVGLPIILGSLFAGGFLAGWALTAARPLARGIEAARRRRQHPAPGESSSPTEKEPEATLHTLPFGTRGGGGLALGGSSDTVGPRGEQEAADDAPTDCTDPGHRLEHARSVAGDDRSPGPPRADAHAGGVHRAGPLLRSADHPGPGHLPGTPHRPGAGGEAGRRNHDGPAGCHHHRLRGPGDQSRGVEPGSPARHRVRDGRPSSGTSSVSIPSPTPPSWATRCSPPPSSTGGSVDLTWWPRPTVRRESASG